MRPVIGWSDFAVAANVLRIVDRRKLSAIATMLGLEYSVSADVPPVGAVREMRRSPDELPWQSMATFIEPPYKPAVDSSHANTTTRPEETVGGAHDAGEAPGGALTFLFSVTEARGATFVPLIDRRVVRAALLGALKQKAFSDRPDLSALVDEASRARPIGVIPMEPEMRIRGRVVAVADMSEAMSPYHEDARDAIRELSRVLTPDNLRVVWAGDADVLHPENLMRQCMGSERAPQILVFTTLGSFGGFGLGTHYKRAWEGFARLAEREGLDVTIVTPRRHVSLPFDLTSVRSIAWEELPNINSRFGRSNRRTQP